ncbi:hypothetical protein QBC44DRAFT_314232 [Cladorrhinum sp. PSN332]|nr:hypothetical protein QBC44DRAFT_314232 [Cladorrhinum sp. PSN332]
MDETAVQDPNTPKAPKDRNCPFCGQAFTSSSLGRHLDLWIKDNNPRPPDGVHDVDAIRKLRGHITRRRPKASATRRTTSVSIGTPAGSIVSEDAEHSASNSPLLQQKGRKELETEIAKKYPFNTPWEATGVINDLSPGQKDGDSARGGEGDDQGEGAGFALGSLHRSMSRRMMKQQLNATQEYQDAIDTAKAAELALREVIGSWRAAKHQVDIDSMPFDFDPLSLDFPALTLQCLEPPPTLFASTQYPTASSWSISPPGATQLEALREHFQEEFQKWKITCAAATTAVVEDLSYPPSATTHKVDVRDEVRKAEKKAEKMEKQVYEHIQATYNMWSGLPEEERGRVWALEMARGLGRSKKELHQMKRTQDILRQENAHLKIQIDQLSRLQQPREFKISPPSLIYIDEKLVNHMLAEGVVEKRSSVGLNLADRHADLNTVSSAAIDRWKNVIVSSRSASTLQAQRPLGTTSTAHSPTTSTGEGATQSAAVVGQTPATLPRPSVTPQPQTVKTSPTTGGRPAAPSVSAGRETTPSVAAATVTPSEPPTTSGNPEVDADQDMADQDAHADSDGDHDGDADEDEDADADADADADGEMDVDTESFAAKPEPPQQIETTSTQPQPGSNSGGFQPEPLLQPRNGVGSIHNAHAPQPMFAD